ncbi:MAG: SDR family oxidoreductase [Myxococcota bacterium]
MRSTRTLVTGAGRGMGLEFARQCLDRGDRVYAGVRRPDDASQLRALDTQYPERLLIFSLDVEDSGSITRAVEAVREKTDRLDLLINNAGINSASAGIEPTQRNVRFGELEASGMLRMLHVNAVAPILVTQAFVELLEQGDRPRVINVSSWLGSIERKSAGGNYGYCASKAALNMLGRTLAFDLKARGIITLLFNPGWVQTDMRTDMRTDMGGKNAELSVTQAVSGVLGTSDTASLEDTGRFFQWDGTEHPW